MNWFRVEISCICKFNKRWVNPLLQNYLYKTPKIWVLFYTFFLSLQVGHKMCVILFNAFSSRLRYEFLIFCWLFCEKKKIHFEKYWWSVLWRILNIVFIGFVVYLYMGKIKQPVMVFYLSFIELQNNSCWHVYVYY